MTELKKSTKKRVSEGGEKDENHHSKKSKPSTFKGKPNSYDKPQKYNNSNKFQNSAPQKFNKFQNSNQQNEPMEKQNWTELKKHKKELKIKRKINKSKDMYDMDVQAKKIYEELKM